jgi:hypothetical protein
MSRLTAQNGHAVLRRVVALALIVLTIAAGVRDFPQLNDFVESSRHRIGWDLEVICTSLQALSSGHNPYLESSPFPLPYAILHLYLFKPVCALGTATVVYGIIFTLIAIGSGIMLWRMVPAFAFDRIAVLAAILFSFDAFRWDLLTGNAAIIELPLAVAIVLLLAERRYSWAGIVFGLMASLKLLPFFGVIAFLFLPESNRLRLQSAGLATGSFLAVHTLNAVLFSQWLPTYAAHLMGRVPGGDFYEFGGVYNQDTIDFVLDGFRRLGINEPLPSFALALLGLAIAGLASMACARKTPERGELPPVAVVSLVMLILWLFLFRQKNYAFETFIPFMIAAGYGAGRETVMSAVAASIIVPGAFISHIVKISVLNDYYQLVATWAAVLALLFGAIIQQRWQNSQRQAKNGFAPLPVSSSPVLRGTTQ